MKKYKNLTKKQLIKEKKKTFRHHENTTVCILDIIIPYTGISCNYDLAAFIRKRFPEISPTMHGFEARIIRKTKCSKEDKFDIKKGETIAYSKCQLRQYILFMDLMLAVLYYIKEETKKISDSYKFILSHGKREIDFLRSVGCNIK